MRLDYLRLVDLRCCDRSVWVFVLVATACGAALVFQYKKVSVGYKNIEVAKSAFYTGQRASLAEHDDQIFLKKNRSDFKQVVEKNRFDSRNRVQWVSLLESAKSMLGISEMSFEIYPSREVSTNHPELFFTIGVESIELKISLLHDGKLVELMDYLRVHAPISYAVTKMEIAKSDRKIDNGMTSPKIIGLEVLCTIEWYSIDLKSESVDA